MGECKAGKNILKFLKYFMKYYFMAKNFMKFYITKYMNVTDGRTDSRTPHDGIGSALHSVVWKNQQQTF